MDRDYPFTPDSDCELSSFFDEQCMDLQSPGNTSTSLSNHIAAYAPLRPPTPPFNEHGSTDRTPNTCGYATQNKAVPSPPTKSRPTPKRIINVEEVPGYPPASAQVPLYLTCVELCQQYPNSLYGENLDSFIQYNWSCTQIFECLPGPVQRAMTANHLNSKNPSNAIAKRISKRRTRLEKSGELELLLSGRKLRIEGRGPGFRANGRFPVPLSKQAWRQKRGAKMQNGQLASSKPQRPLPPLTFPRCTTDQDTPVMQRRPMSITSSIRQGVSSLVRTCQPEPHIASHHPTLRSQNSHLPTILEQAVWNMDDPRFNSDNKATRSPESGLMASSHPHSYGTPNWEYADPEFANPELSGLRSFSETDDYQGLDLVLDYIRTGSNNTEPFDPGVVDADLGNTQPLTGGPVWPDLPLSEQPVRTRSDQFIPETSVQPVYDWRPAYCSEDHRQHKAKGAEWDDGTYYYDQPLLDTEGMNNEDYGRSVHQNSGRTDQKSATGRNGSTDNEKVDEAWSRKGW